MKKEEIEDLKIRGPLHFEHLEFIKIDVQEKDNTSGLTYRESIKGYSKIQHFYKQSIRLIHD